MGKGFGRGKRFFCLALAALMLLAGSGISLPARAMMTDDLDDLPSLDNMVIDLDELAMPEDIADALEGEYRLLLEEASMADPDDTEFTLVDMNGDGLRELIISTGTTGGGRLYSFYAGGTGGKAVPAGEYTRYADFYAAYDGEGVYAVLDKKGKRYVDLITIWGEGDKWELFTEEVSVSNRTTRDFEDGKLLVMNNAGLFLSSGEELAVLAEDEYIFPDSDRRYLTVEELAVLDAKTLRLARNEIYARHGRSFQTRDLREYFEAQSWYHGYLTADQFDERVFNKYENANIRLISSVEKGNY